MRRCPRLTGNGERYLQFGQTWTSNAYFKVGLLQAGKESPVFESYSHSFRKTDDGFEEWLQSKCAATRKRFTRQEWLAVESDPLPIDRRELAIVAARRDFRWRVVGIAPNGDLHFEVQNRSKTRLPYLSVGIEGTLRPPPAGPFEGAIFLPVGTIKPGATKVIENDCYKEFVRPRKSNAHALPEPGPEDRDEYWEFKPLSRR